MRELFWMAVCLFASIGIAQCICWLAGLLRRPKGMSRGYHVLPVYDDPDRLEAQLRYILRRLGWCSDGSKVLILVDMGLGAECRNICDRILRENPGLMLCGPTDLSALLWKMDSPEVFRSGQLENDAALASEPEKRYH